MRFMSVARVLRCESNQFSTKCVVGKSGGAGT